MSHPLPEAAQGALERLEKTFENEIKFDKQIGWDSNVRLLVEKAMGDRIDKYKTRIGPVIDLIMKRFSFAGKNPDSFFAQIDHVELKQGSIAFKDSANNLLGVQVDVTDGFEDMINEAYEEDCEILHRRTRRDIYESFGRLYGVEDVVRKFSAPELPAAPATPSAGAGERAPTTAAAAGSPASGPAASAPAVPASGPTSRPSAAPKFPRSPGLLHEIASGDAERRRLGEFFKNLSHKRAGILAAVMREDGGGHKVTARIDPLLLSYDADQFEKCWREFDYGDLIDDLIAREPHGDYQFNPFRSLGWNHEMIRQLLQNGEVRGRISFREVVKRIYNDRIKDFKKNLKKDGVPEKITDLLDEDEDITQTYGKLQRLARNPKDLPEDKLKHTIQALGDYIGYATKFINLVNELRRVAPQKSADRSVTMYQKVAETDEKASQRNRTIEALTSLFRCGTQAPKVYESEWQHLWHPENEREMNFSDLHGNVYTVRGDWFSDNMAGETAYVNAFEAAEEDNGTVNEQSAISNLNYLLQLGIAAYSNVRQSDEPMESIIARLGESGAQSGGKRLNYSGNVEKDSKNLYAALEIRDLADVKKGGSYSKDLLCYERKRFIRIGAVINHRLKGRETEQTGAEALNKAIKLRLREKQADEIIAVLQSATPPPFSKAQLKQLKSELIGGAMVIVNKGAPGLGLDYHLAFDNNVSIDITAASMDWQSGLVGVAVGYKLKTSEKSTISVNFGPGYQIAESNSWKNIALGGGVRATWDMGKIDAYFEAGGGATLGGAPLIFAGLGVNRDKSQQRYEHNLEQLEINNNIQELDAAGDKAFGMVKANPEKYPEMDATMRRIDALDGLPLYAKSDIFMTCYEAQKEGMKKKAFDSTKKEGWDRFVGVGGGIAIAGGAIMPYIYVECTMWSRNLVRRVGSSSEMAETLADAKIQALLDAAEKKTGKKANLDNKEYNWDNEVIKDEHGNFMLRRASKFPLDLSHLEDFKGFEEASSEARIAVQPVAGNYGLIELTPGKEHGNTEVYIDPQLGNDIVLVTQGSHLYLSVKKGVQINIIREDDKYPFKYRGEVTRTRIAITQERVSIDSIRNESACYFYRNPDSDWTARSAPGRPDGKKQDNILSWDGYMKWWGEGRADRLEEVDTTRIQGSYNLLVKSIEVSPDHVLEVRSDIETAIKTFEKSPLNKDQEAFLLEFRKLFTERHAFDRPKGKFGERHIEETGDINWKKLIETLNKKFAPSGPPLNAEELNLALSTLTLASFQDIQTQGKKKPQEAYKMFLERFERPMLNSLFGDFYHDAAKAKRLTDWVIKKFEGTDITGAPQEVKIGMLFATLVGSKDITGLRYIYNYRSDKDVLRSGVLGALKLDLNSSDPDERDVAKFWFEKLSPYKMGAENEKEMYENLESPFVIKVLPAVAIALSPEEMDQLTVIYENRRRGGGTSSDITSENINTVKKFLAICDKVRAAEIEAKPSSDNPLEVPLDETWSALITKGGRPDIMMGVYKKCGNLTGLVGEDFALLHKPSRTIYLDAMATEYLQSYAEYSQKNYNFVIGLALPIRARESVTTRPEKPGVPPEKIPQPAPKPTGGVGQASTPGNAVKEPHGTIDTGTAGE